MLLLLLLALLFDKTNFRLVSGEKFAASTACHSSAEAAYCASAIGQKAYSMARSGSLSLPGFPDFEQVVAELKQTANEVASPDFAVCIAAPNALAVRQSLVDYWAGQEMFSVDMAALLEKHNKKYNPTGIKRGYDEVESHLPSRLSLLYC